MSSTKAKLKYFKSYLIRFYTKQKMRSNSNIKMLVLISFGFLFLFMLDLRISEMEKKNSQYVNWVKPQSVRSMSE